MEDAHAKTVDEVQNFFNVDPEKGLTPDQVKRYQAKYGPNGMYNNHNLLFNEHFKYCFDLLIKVYILDIYIILDSSHLYLLKCN